MTVVDAGFLVDFLRGRPEARSRVRAAETSGEVLYVTPVVAYEVLVGAHHVGGKSLARARELLRSLTFLPLDIESVEEAARAGADLRRRGTPIGPMGTLNAGAALRIQDRVLSRDSDYARVRGLLAESY